MLAKRPDIKKIKNYWVAPDLLLSAGRSPENILYAVAGYYDIKVDRIKDKSRKRPMPEIRFMCMHLMREYTLGISLREIGEQFGGLNHTSVLFGLRQFQNLHDTEDAYRKDYYEIIKLLKTRF